MEQSDKYPQDDELSLHQGVGTCNLDIYYAHQFVQNEILEPYTGLQLGLKWFRPEPSYEGCGYKITYSTFEHGCPVEGTISGVIESDGKMIATLHPEMFVKRIGSENDEGLCNAEIEDGRLVIYWSFEVPNNHHVRVDYEFHCS